MNRSDVILELQLVPELLKQAEAIYVDAVSELDWAKHQLLAKECEVIGDGTGYREKRASTTSGDVAIHERFTAASFADGRCRRTYEG